MELETADEVEIGEESMVEAEAMLESEAEMEFEDAIEEADPEPEMEPEVEVFEEPMVEAEPEPEPAFDSEPADAPKHKIVNIEMKIAELYDNIGTNMSVIETITKLLSGTESDALEAITQAKETEPALLLEKAGDYATKIEYIEMRFSQLAESIKHDMKVIEGISNLLSTEE